VIVAVVALLMVALGVWQLARSEEKSRALARYDANLAAPTLIVTDRVDLAADLFRKAEAFCEPSRTRLEGAGRFGFRRLADCRTLADGQRLQVQLGTTRDLESKMDWGGGRVVGYLTEAPDSRSVLRQAFDRVPPGPMIVADPPLDGLAASPRPSVAEIPNNHRSYAFQWFAFAVLAMVIYALALRQRRRVRA
jgi:surfeit locus 1 family protein